MLKIGHILCPIDFSEFSARAYDYADSLARHYDSKLTLQHVVQSLTSSYPSYPFPASMEEIDRSLTEDARSRLQEMAKSHAQDGFKPEFAVDQGLVTDCILSFARKHSVDLIVMGTHGTRGIDHLLTGSVTEKVLRKARCPVLAVRKPSHDFVAPRDKQEPVRLHKLLCCTDFSDHSRGALEYAFSLAMEYNAELTLLYVLEQFPGATEPEAETAKAIRDLEKAIPPDARNWCNIKCVVRFGEPYQEIIQLALESRADLILMGVRGRNALDLALFGSTVHRVIQRGPSPVLAVRA